MGESSGNVPQPPSLRVLPASSTDGGAVLLGSENSSDWMLQIEAAALDVADTALTPPIAVTLVAALGSAFPAVHEKLADAPAIRVIFSPQARRLLASGELKLMRTGSDLLPTAVDVSGRIVETARVAPGAVATATGGAALGAAVAGSWPILLAGGLAAVAAAAEHRWLEQTFGQLQAAVERLEHRLRDDDAGTLVAALRLSHLVEPAARGDGLPPPLRVELAVARQDVERVYLSRARFVNRFKRALEAAQNAEEAKKGVAAAWAGDVARDLTDRKTGLVDELIVFLEAMIVRARLAACTAGVLAGEGGGWQALRMLDDLEAELRDDYWDLQRRISALARQEPTSTPWQRFRSSIGNRVPLLADGNPDQAYEVIRSLDTEMRRTVGAALPERDQAVEALVSAAEVRALSGAS